MYLIPYSEETIIVNRALRDDPSKGTMHNRQAITPRLLYRALRDHHLWPMYMSPDWPTLKCLSLLRLTLTAPYPVMPSA